MTWIALSGIIITSLIKILMTCLPLGAVEWLQSKFEIHSKLDEKKVSVTIGGKHVDGEQKRNIIRNFNNAIFMEKHYVYPGNEENFLNRENIEPPIIVDNPDSKNPFRVHIFHYHDHIDVVKQYNKKIVAYSLFNQQT